MLGLRTAAVFLVMSWFVLPGDTAVAATAGCPGGSVPAPGPGGTICIPASDPGGGSGGSGGNSGGGSGGNSGGGADDCNYFLADPQPPVGSAPWDGHTPDEGSIYLKDCDDEWAAYGFTMIFLPNGDDPPPPNPATVAQRALGQMKLTVPDVHMAPSPPSMTYVGLETWLWMPGNQWSTLTKSVTAGSTTVTVSAEPRRVTWDMGPGSVTCHDAGRVWDIGRMSKSAKTSCQYRYERVSDFQPTKKFKVSATITFRATWRCSGNCLTDEGTLGEVEGLPGTSEIRVGERQSVNVSPRDGS